VNGDGPVAVENAPLNLRLRRVPYTKVRRMQPLPSKETLQLLGLLVPGALLLAACRRGGRFAVPAAVGLATGSIFALAKAIIANRKQAQDDVIDERLEETFPASDPPAF
jgi:hypothetical protein